MDDSDVGKHCCESDPLELENVECKEEELDDPNEQPESPAEVNPRPKGSGLRFGRPIYSDLRTNSNIVCT